MSGLGLRLGAAIVVLFSFVGSFFYVGTHVKNPNAPLRPPVADKPVPALPAASPPPANSSPTLPPLFGTTRPGVRGSGAPVPAATATPRLSLQPGVRTATLEPLTFTHTS